MRKLSVCSDPVNIKSWKCRLGENPSNGFEELHDMVHWTMWEKFDKVSHNVDYETYIYE